MYRTKWVLCAAIYLFEFEFATRERERETATTKLTQVLRRCATKLGAANNNTNWRCNNDQNLTPLAHTQAASTDNRAVGYQSAPASTGIMGRGGGKKGNHVNPAQQEQQQWSNNKAATEYLMVVMNDGWDEFKQTQAREISTKMTSVQRITRNQAPPQCCLVAHRSESSTNMTRA